MRHPRWLQHSSQSRREGFENAKGAINDIATKSGVKRAEVAASVEVAAPKKPRSRKSQVMVLPLRLHSPGEARSIQQRPHLALRSWGLWSVLLMTVRPRQQVLIPRGWEERVPPRPTLKMGNHILQRREPYKTQL